MIVLRPLAVRLGVAWLAWRFVRPADPAAEDAAAGTAGGDDLLAAALSFGQTQLLAQIADETSIDGRAMGILAFNGALLAADIAAKDLLGRWWWTALVAVAGAALPCLRSVISRETDLGPLASTFYAAYGGQPSVAARKQLLADVGGAFTANTARIKAKRIRLRVAIVSLFVGLTLASLLITLDGPATISKHAARISATPRAASAGPGADAGAVAVAARRARRDPPLASSRSAPGSREDPHAI